MTADVKVGDVVHVRATIAKAKLPHPMSVPVIIGVTEVLVDRSWIVHVEPSPIKAGDRVKWNHGGCKGSVIAITTGPDGHALAWVQAEGVHAALYTLRLSDLHHAPQPGET